MTRRSGVGKRARIEVLSKQGFVDAGSPDCWQKPGGDPEEVRAVRIGRVLHPEGADTSRCGDAQVACSSSWGAVWFSETEYHPPGGLVDPRNTARRAAGRRQKARASDPAKCLQNSKRQSKDMWSCPSQQLYSQAWVDRLVDRLSKPED